MTQPATSSNGGDLYQALVQTMTDAVFVSQDGTFRVANEAGLKLLGVSRLDELPSLDPMELLHPSQQEAVRDRLRLMIAQGAGAAVPLSIQTWRRLDGSWLELEVAASLTTFRGRAAVLLVARAMSDVREAELRLVESEHRFRSLVETAGSVILCLNADHTITEWNREAERLSEWPRHEAIGRNYLQLLLPREYWEAVTADIKKVLGGEPTRNFEDVMVSRSGKRLTLLWNVTRLLDAHHQPLGIIAIGQDITERKAVERELQQQADLLEESQSVAHVGGWEIDLGSNRIYWTEETFRIHELSSADYEPSLDNAIGFYAPSSQGIIRAAVEAVIAVGTPFDHELELITSRGRHIWVRSIGKAKWHQGHVTKVYGAFQDITARKLHEQAIEQFGDAQRLMLSELDHRVRNNLASLSALIDISARTARDVPDLASAIRGRVQAMSAVHVLLSRGHWSSVDLTELIELMIPADLRGAVTIRGDRRSIGPRQCTALGMVMQELVANSLKYGALSVDRGRISITWSTREISGDGTEMHLQWKETDGPAIMGEFQPGLGTELIRGFVKTELRGQSLLDYPRAGAHHQFTFRLETIKDEEPAGAPLG